MTNVAICTPHGGLVRPEWYRSIASMQNVSKQHMFHFVEVDMMIVGKARNMCVEAARAAGCEVFWFIDDDVIVPENAGVLIDQCLSLGVVSGIYYSRRSPYTPQLFELANKEGFPDKYWPRLTFPDAGLFQTDAVGAGCLAVHASVIDTLEARYKALFTEEAAKINNPWLRMLVEQLSPWFEFFDRKGEDMYFCERCADAGQTIWVNADIKCGHIGDQLIDETQFNYLRDNNMIHRIDEQGAVIE